MARRRNRRPRLLAEHLHTDGTHVAVRLLLRVTRKGRYALDVLDYDADEGSVLSFEDEGEAWSAFFEKVEELLRVRSPSER